MRGAPGERRDLAEVRHRAQAFAFMSAPIDTPCYVDRLARNWLCGLTQHGSGIYTAEGITKLCEGLKGSAVTSLECATPRPERLLSCQRPLTLRTTKHSSALAVCDITASVPKEEPRLQRASRATQHCKCSSKPTGTRTG